MEKVKCKYCGKVGRPGTKCHICSRTVQEIVIPEDEIIIMSKRIKKKNDKKKKVTKVEEYIKNEEDKRCKECTDEECDCSKCNDFMEDL